MRKKKYTVKYIVAVLVTGTVGLCANDYIPLNYYWILLAICFLMVPILLSLIDSDLAKSPIN